MGVKENCRDVDSHVPLASGCESKEVSQRHSSVMQNVVGRRDAEVAQTKREIPAGADRAAKAADPQAWLREICLAIDSSLLARDSGTVMEKGTVHSWNHGKLMCAGASNVVRMQQRLPRCVDPMEAEGVSRQLVEVWHERAVEVSHT